MQPEALLQNRFHLGELRPRIHAAHFVLLDDLAGDAAALGARDCDGIGEIIFRGLVLVIDPIQKRQKQVTPESHDAGVAKRQSALLGRRLFLLGYRKEFPSFAGDETAIPFGIFCVEADDGHICAVLNRHGEVPDTFPRNKRRVAIKNQHRAAHIGKSLTRHQHGMGGSKTFRLFEEPRLDRRGQRLEAFCVGRNNHRTR